MRLKLEERFLRWSYTVTVQWDGQTLLDKCQLLAQLLTFREFQKYLGLELDRDVNYNNPL